MKISSETLGILQKYTQINQSILVQEGSVLRTIDCEKTITSSAKIEEDFPKEFAVYDLPNFLQVLKMFDGADVDFGDEDTNYCVVSYNGNPNESVRYMYASPEAVESVKKDIVMPQTEINFKLSKNDLSRLVKAATTMELPHILITPAGDGRVTLTATSVDNPASNTFCVNVDAELTIDTFYVIIDFAKFVNLLETDYNVGISTAEISHFYNEKIQYWIALNAQTTFEG